MTQCSLKADLMAEIFTDICGFVVFSLDYLPKIVLQYCLGIKCEYCAVYLQWLNLEEYFSKYFYCILGIHWI